MKMLISKLKIYIENMWLKAYILNKKNILDFTDKNSQAHLLDLGCDDGAWTTTLAHKVTTSYISGIEIMEEAANLSIQKGIQCYLSDLNYIFPFDSDSFDIIHANQVIEHITNLDNFVSEIYRVLKPGGYIVISTENGSSWCNIFASVMGWQIFSLTNISSKKSGIGNPFAIHRNKANHLASWTHKTILNYLGLKELFTTYNFRDVSINGAGYFPLPAKLGSLDTRHAHFITIKCFK